MRVTVHDDRLHIGDLEIVFMRTLRIPDDGSVYRLPPGLGRFPIRRVDDHRDRVPEGWRAHGGVFIPMYQREAMWIRLGAPTPHAVKVAAGRVNAVSGNPWRDGLYEGPDADVPEYLVVPEQPWLDGFNAGDGRIRQFVAMPMGEGYTVEGQLSGEEIHGGIQIEAFAARPGAIRREWDIRLHAAPPHVVGCRTVLADAPMAPAPVQAEMGLGAGGRMTQKIHPDPHGLEVWDPERRGRVFVHIVNSATWREITGEPAPPTPISAADYAAHGLPWFDLYDEGAATAGASEALDGVKSVAELDAEKGVPTPPDPTVPAGVDPKAPQPVTDGDW